MKSDEGDDEKREEQVRREAGEDLDDGLGIPGKAGVQSRSSHRPAPRSAWRRYDDDDPGEGDRAEPNGIGEDAEPDRSDSGRRVPQWRPPARGPPMIDQKIDVSRTLSATDPAQAGIRRARTGG